MSDEHSVLVVYFDWKTQGFTDSYCEVKEVRLITHGLGGEYDICTYIYIYICMIIHIHTDPDVSDRKGDPAGLCETPTSGSMSLTFCVDHSEPPKS